jgi:hypothetical protein
VKAANTHRQFVAAEVKRRSAAAKVNIEIQECSTAKNMSVGSISPPQHCVSVAGLFAERAELMYERAQLADLLPTAQRMHESAQRRREQMLCELSELRLAIALSEAAHSQKVDELKKSIAVAKNRKEEASSTLRILDGEEHGCGMGQSTGIGLDENRQMRRRVRNRRRLPKCTLPHSA